MSAHKSMTETATMTPRRVFAYEGVGYTRETGAPAPRVAPVTVTAKVERFPLFALVAVGFAAGTVLAVVAMAAGLF
ncbi:hypothetical protein BAJUN_01950 [Bajunvirus bajun]|uniref:Uncharacterized protein n=1 Tax=Brevundimonas phage vB_BgoS-Bajun TaxID=2948594 RepID=A0A9E7SU61_9CAUD|nr:hypothetical protein BAJUN_01950 [Brevundimonas phage vB_BgoS-Bajun]